MNADNADRLIDIRDEIKELVKEAIQLLPKGVIHIRAKSYWYPHILTALDNDHDYMGTSMCTMEDSYNEMLEEGEDDV